MANPVQRNSLPEPGGSTDFKPAKLTPEEADAVAATIRPSWEVDASAAPPAPPIAASALANPRPGVIPPPADSQSAIEQNGAYAVSARPAPPRTPASQPPAESVIIDGSIPTERPSDNLPLDSAALREFSIDIVETGAPPIVAAVGDAQPNANANANALPVAGAFLDPSESAQSFNRSAEAAPQAMGPLEITGRVLVSEGDEAFGAHRSKRRLLIAVGAVAAVVVVIGIAISFGGSSESNAPAASVGTTSNSTAPIAAPPPAPPPAPSAPVKHVAVTALPVAAPPPAQPAVPPPAAVAPVGMIAPSPYSRQPI